MKKLIVTMTAAFLFLGYGLSEDEALENFGIVWVGPVDGKGFCKGQIRLFPLEPFTKEKKGEWNGY